MTPRRAVLCDPPRPDFPAAPSPWPAPESDLERLLNHPVDIRFDGVRWTDALLDLTRKYGLPMSLDSELSAKDLGAERLVTLSSRKARLGNVLADILSNAELVYRARDGKLEVTTRQSAESHLEWRTYRVGDLVRAGLPLRQLVNVILSTVFSEADVNRDEDDQEIPTVVPSGSSLLVRQYAAKHELIEALLAGLRSRGRTGVFRDDGNSEPLLDRRVSVDLDSIPFDRFVEWLEKTLQVPIVVNRGVNEELLDPNNLVTIHASDISVGSLLFHVGDALSDRLCAVVRNHELLLEPADAARQIPNLRIYDVRSLLPDWPDLRHLVVRYAGRGEAWEDTDSQAARSKLEAIAGFLIVNQPSRVQGDVRNFLRRIGRSQAGAVSIVPLTGIEVCERALRAQLAAPCSLPGRKISLRDLPRWLREQCGLPVRLDSQAVDAAGINYDVDIDLGFDGRPLEEALQRALDPLHFAVFIEREMVCLAPDDDAGEHRDVRIYPAWRVLGRGMTDRRLGRIAIASTSDFLSDEAPDNDEQREFALIETGGGLVFARARPRLQRAVAAGLGWSDYESSQMAEWPIAPRSNRGVELWRAGQDLSEKSRINP